MDINPFLQEWHLLEPERCTHVGGDVWTFFFDKLPQRLEKEIPVGSTATLTQTSQITCDVISVHGVGVIEDLIYECIEKRSGWSYELNFDRSEEFFLAGVKDGKSIEFVGLDSLNPGIALLTAYLNAIKNTH